MTFSLTSNCQNILQPLSHALLFIAPLNCVFHVVLYRGADKSLDRPTSRCIFLMVRIFCLMLVLLYTCIYRVSQEELIKLRESVPYVKLYRYNPKHLYPKLNGYGDNGHRKVWASGVSTYCTSSVTP